MAPVERQLVLYLEVEEMASQLSRSRSPALALRLSAHAKATAARLLADAADGRPSERALLLLTLAEIARILPPSVARDADAPSGTTVARITALEEAQGHVTSALALLPGGACGAGADGGGDGGGGGGNGCGRGGGGGDGGGRCGDGGDGGSRAAASFSSGAGARSEGAGGSCVVDAAVGAMKVKDLKEELTRRGLPVDGKKQQLAERLQGAMAPEGPEATGSGDSGNDVMDVEAAEEEVADDEALELRARLRLLLAELRLELGTAAFATPALATPAFATPAISSTLVGGGGMGGGGDGGGGVGSGGGSDGVADALSALSLAASPGEGGEESGLAAVRDLCVAAVRDWRQLLQQPGACTALASASGTVASLLRCSKLAWGLMAAAEAVR